MKLRKLACKLVAPVARSSTKSKQFIRSWLAVAVAGLRLHIPTLDLRTDLAKDTLPTFKTTEQVVSATGLNCAGQPNSNADWREMSP